MSTPIGPVLTCFFPSNTISSGLWPDVRSSVIFRFTVVRLDAGGAPPERCMVTLINSADDLSGAREAQARLERVRPGVTFGIVDRLNCALV